MDLLRTSSPRLGLSLVSPWVSYPLSAWSREHLEIGSNNSGVACLSVSRKEIAQYGHPEPIGVRAHRHERGFSIKADGLTTNPR